MVSSEKKISHFALHTSHLIRGGTLLLLLLLFAGTSRGQQAAATSKFDTASMLIGDHTSLKLQFTGPKGAMIIWPAIPDTILGNIVVIGRGRIDTLQSKANEPLTMSQEFTVTCFDSGFYTLPAIPFSYRIPLDTTLYTVNTSLASIMVHTVKVDTSQAIKPIKGPLSVPITFREMLPWILAALGVAALIVAGIWYLRRRKKNKPLFTMKPRVKLLPHEVALTEMEKLRVKKLWQNGRVKEYYSELTGIVRQYIEERFSLPALEQTSAEIMESLIEEGNAPGQAIDRLSELLMRADMVKFAKALPDATENDKSLNDAIAFVYDTTGSREATAIDDKPVGE